jgi:hypothetical protein
MKWTKMHYYVLGRTGLELHPEHASAYWFVVDGSNFDRALSAAMPLEAAKKVAERIVEERRKALEESRPKGGGLLGATARLLIKQADDEG